jgi:hypothetical protein
MYGGQAAPDRPDRLSDRPPKDRQGLQLVSLMAKRFLAEYAEHGRLRI